MHEGFLLNVVIKHFFVFCDTQSHVVTVMSIVLYFPFIYLPPLIVILVPSYLGPDALFQSSLTVCSSNSIVPLQKKKFIPPFPPSIQFSLGCLLKTPSYSIFSRDLDPKVKGVCGGDYP